MSDMNPEPVEMSGALPENDVGERHQSNNSSEGHPSNGREPPVEKGTGSDEIGFRAPPPLRRQSFFVIPNRGRDAAAQHQSGPIETIAINPSQKTTTFQIGKGKKRRRKQARESSLDAVLRHEINGPTIYGQEAQIALPDSRPTTKSSAQDETGRQNSFASQSKNSLDIIVEKSIPPPFSIALPDSRPRSLEEMRDTLPRVTPEEAHEPQESRKSFVPPFPDFNWPPYNYHDIITRASGFLRHIEDGRIRKESRNDVFRLTYQDFPLTLPDLFFASNTLNNNNERDLFEEFGYIPEGVKQRVILVEDLSPRTINFLGCRYGISPEFFEEHLINSGYNGSDYSDPPANTWPTSGLKKSYFSMRWHRPVYRLPIIPFSENDLNEILDPEIGRIEDPVNDASDMSIYRTQTNIFRSEWGLWTNPAITPHNRRVCGWEERVSIWTQSVPDEECQIIVVLVDPLPSLAQEIEREVLATRQIDDLETEGSTLPPMTPEELARLERYIKRKKLASRKPQPSRLRRILQGIKGDEGEDEDDDDDDSGLSGKFELVRSIKIEHLQSLVVFEQTALRTSVAVDYDDAFRSPPIMNTLQQQLGDTKSTAEDFWQRVAVSSKASDASGMSPVAGSLFQIVNQDSKSLLRLLHTSLNGITEEILDDTKMEENLAMWRLLITRAQLELPELKESLTRFLSFLQILDPPNQFPLSAEMSVPDGERGIVSKDFQDLCKQIDDMMQRLQTASSSLTSNMALLDSRRSIAEAQAVTKLTELAFFFIPISFAATLFGMQIEQFENRAPLWTFVITGLGFVSASYLLRLLIRSTWIRNLHEAYNASIKIYADAKRRPVRRGKIPASLFLSWAEYELDGAVRAAFTKTSTFLGRSVPEMLNGIGRSPIFTITSLLVASAAATIAPIVVLWTRPLALGIKIMITIVVLCLVGLVAAVSWRMTDRKSRSGLSRTLRNVSKGFDIVILGLAQFFMNPIRLVLCVLVLVIVLLVVIWTSHLGHGIKIAITTIFVVIIVVAIAFWAVYQILMVVRRTGNNSSSEESSGGSRSLVSD